MRAPAPLPLRLGYSPCPNDTTLFWALTHGLLPGELSVAAVLSDVQTLNRWATEGRLPVTKLSYRAALSPEVQRHYGLLRAGGAFGLGVGPLLVCSAKSAGKPLHALRVASPGDGTTAELLWRLAVPKARPTVPLPFHAGLAAVQAGEVDAALVIHEARFVYRERGLTLGLDLGAWWAERTGLPLPLGAILLRRDLAERANGVSAAIRDSLRHAREHPGAALAHVRAHAQEDDAAIREHVRTYVNALTEDVGERGERAVRELLRRGQAAGALGEVAEPLFLDRVPTPG